MLAPDQTVRDNHTSGSSDVQSAGVPRFNNIVPTTTYRIAAKDITRVKKDKISGNERKFKHEFVQNVYFTV